MGFLRRHLWFPVYAAIANAWAAHKRRYFSRHGRPWSMVIPWSGKLQKFRPLTGGNATYGMPEERIKTCEHCRQPVAKEAMLPHPWSRPDAFIRPNTAWTWEG